MTAEPPRLGSGPTAGTASKITEFMKVREDGTRHVQTPERLITWRGWKTGVTLNGWEMNEKPETATLIDLFASGSFGLEGRQCLLQRVTERLQLAPRAGGLHQPQARALDVDRSDQKPILGATVADGVDA